MAKRQYTVADLYGADGRPHAADIHQDLLYNCYFLAPIGTLGEQQPGRIQDAIHFNAETGDFTVSLYRPPNQQQRAQGLTDPFQETITVSQADIRRNIDEKGGGTVDNSAQRSGPLWPTVIEAGFAEVYGRDAKGRVNLNRAYLGLGNPERGGSLSDGIYALTGESGRTVRIESPLAPPFKAVEPVESVDSAKRPAAPAAVARPFDAPTMGVNKTLDAAYNEVEQALKANKPVSLSTMGTDVNDGLEERHAYMVMGVSRNPQTNEAQLTLRNPYGNNERAREGNHNIGAGWNKSNPEITVSLNRLVRDGSFAEFNIGPASRVQTQKQDMPAPVITPEQITPTPNKNDHPQSTPPIGPPTTSRSPDDKDVMGVTTGLQLGNDFREKGHPGNAAYENMLHEVKRMETTNGIAHGPNSELIAAALLVKAEQSKFRTAEIVRMEPDGMVSTLKLSLNEPIPKLSVDPKEVVAQGQSFEKSTQQWAAARSPHYASDAPAAERTLDQVKALAQMTSADQCLFEKIRQNVPPHISDDVVAKAMLQAKRDDVLTADKIATVDMAGDSIMVRGQTAVKRSMTDVSEPAAPMAETTKQTESFNQQLAIDLRLQQEQALAKKQEQENQDPNIPKGPKIA
jgi:hypothetical protein